MFESAGKIMNLTQEYLAANIIEFADHKKYRWASGMMSPVYCDHRKILGNIACRSNVIPAFAEFCNEVKSEVDAVVGVATGGIAYAAWIAEKLNLPMGYVRLQNKDHGKSNRVEGGLSKGMRVLLIEDMISTGGSSLEIVKSLKAEGYEVPHVRALMSYFPKYVTEKFEQQGTKMLAMLEFSSFLAEASVRSIIEKAPDLFAHWEEELKVKCKQENSQRDHKPAGGVRLVLKKP
jgi:orotate phosphoribosyltransferase